MVKKVTCTAESAGWKLCVRGSLSKVQKQPSIREQPVQRSWGGNDLVCSGKRRRLRVGLRNGDLGEDQGRSWPRRGPRFSHEWDGGPGGFGWIFLEDLLAFHGPQSSKKGGVEAKRPRPATGRYWEGVTGPLEGVGRQMAAAGVPQGRRSTGVRQSPSLELGAPPGAFVVEAATLFQQPCSGPGGTHWDGQTEVSGSVDRQTIERGAHWEERAGLGGYCTGLGAGSRGKCTHRPRGALDPRFLKCCPVKGPSLPLPTPGEPCEPQVPLATLGV